MLDAQGDIHERESGFTTVLLVAASFAESQRTEVANDVRCRGMFRLGDGTQSAATAVRGLATHSAAVRMTLRIIPDPVEEYCDAA